MIVLQYAITVIAFSRRSLRASPQGKNFISRKVYQVIIGICAVFLLLFASWFFYNGAIKIFKL